MSNKKAIALYIRLSNEDGDGKDESNSVKNQRDLLHRYVANDSALSGYPLLEFCDDGYSGTNMNRPALKRLLEKVRKQEISCIIVKDLSRLGRNYIDVGNYLEQVFPFLDVRFISIGDNYDSESHAQGLDSIEIALKALVYDLYSKDLSVKVKSGLDTKKRRGEFAASFAPFGYKKSSINKNKLEIDEEKAKIVRLIFDLAISGKGRQETAKILNKQGIPTRSGRPSSFWKRSDISEVLSDETYTGAAIANKRKQITVGGKSVQIPKDEWTVVPNAHPEIISRELYDKVKRKLKKGKSPIQNDTTDNGLKGKVRCKHCGYVLYRSGKCIPKYHCETPSVRPSAECFNEQIEESVIMDAVAATLQNHMRLFVGRVKHKVSKSQPSEAITATNLADFAKSIHLLENEKQELYESYKDERISKSDYLCRKAKLNEQIDGTKSELSEYEKTLAYKSSPKTEIIPNTNDFTTTDNVSSELINALVDTIIVSTDGHIEIRLKYANPFPAETS